MFGGSLRGSVNSLEELSTAEPHLQLTDGNTTAAAAHAHEIHRKHDDADGGASINTEQPPNLSPSYDMLGSGNKDGHIRNSRNRGVVSPVPEEKEAEEPEELDLHYASTSRRSTQQQQRQVQISPVVSPVRSPIHAQETSRRGGGIDGDDGNYGSSSELAAPLSPVPPLNLSPRRTNGTAAPSAPASSSSLSSPPSSQHVSAAAPHSSSTSSKTFLSLEPWVRFKLFLFHILHIFHLFLSSLFFPIFSLGLVFTNACNEATTEVKELQNYVSSFCFILPFQTHNMCIPPLCL